MITGSEPEAIFISAMLILCVIGIGYGFYIMATRRDIPAGLMLVVVSSLIAYILIH